MAREIGDAFPRMPAEHWDQKEVEEKASGRSEGLEAGCRGVRREPQESGHPAGAPPTPPPTPPHRSSPQTPAPGGRRGAHPSWPCLRRPTDCPPRLSSPSPPAPGQPAGRTGRGQRTLPTRPEINISRETELVLSVFTAKGQAVGGGRPEEPRPVPAPQHLAQPGLRPAVRR